MESVQGTIVNGKLAIGYLGEIAKLSRVGGHARNTQFIAGAIKALVALAESLSPDILPEGVTYEGSGPAWMYHLAEHPSRKTFEVPRHVNFAVLHACLADAERRDREERGKPTRELAERIVREVTRVSLAVTREEKVARVVELLMGKGASS